MFIIISASSDRPEAASPVYAFKIGMQDWASVTMESSLPDSRNGPSCLNIPVRQDTDKLSSSQTTSHLQLKKEKRRQYCHSPCVLETQEHSWVDGLGCSRASTYSRQPFHQVFERLLARETYNLTANWTAQNTTCARTPGGRIQRTSASPIPPPAPWGVPAWWTGSKVPQAIAVLRREAIIKEGTNPYLIFWQVSTHQLSVLAAGAQDASRQQSQTG